MTKLGDLEKRVSRVQESTPAPRSEVDIVADFVNQLPNPVRVQIAAYMRERIKLLEQEGKLD